MPISRTSVERFSLPASVWSIFRCAIERTSSRLSSVSGRSVAESSKKTTWLLPRAFAVIIAASAQATSSRGIGSVLRPLGDADRNGDLAGEVASDRIEPLHETGRERDGLLLVASGKDHGELLAADPADDVAGPDGGAQMVGELGQHVVADRVAEDVVHLLEVVDVEHHERDVLVLARRPGQLAAEALVEVPVVVEPGERVGLGFTLEPRTDVRVVERERGCVAEALRQLELLLGEECVLADPVDVERALQRAARDQRHDDQRFRLERSPGHELDARIEVRLVREHGLTVLDRPAGDADAEGEDVLVDLLRPLAPHERRHELPLRLVGLVDVQRLVRDDLVERVRDPDEQRVEALLREKVVENVCEAAVGVEGRGCSGGARDEPNTRLAIAGGKACGFVHI